jgi:CAAX protease family protein
MALSESATSGLFTGPAAYEPRTPWGPIWGLLAAALIVVLSAALMLLSAALPRLTGSGLWRQDAGELAALGIWQVATVILTIAASALFGGRVRDVLALWAPKGAPLVYLKAILLMAALQVAVTAAEHSLLQHDMYADLRPFARLFSEHWGLALMVVGIGAPLSEELLFRGFLLSALASTRLGFWGAAVISTGLWTALHAGYSTAGIAEVFMIGMFFSWLLWRTGSLRVAIFCHALYNSLIVLVLHTIPLPA